ncbi:MAG: ATP-binding protein [Anaerolineae bacterium]
MRNALAHLGPDAVGQRAWEGELSEEFTRGLARDLRQERALGREERTKQLEQLGIEPETLAQALQPVTAYEIIGEHKQLVLLGDPGSGKSTLTRRIAGLFAAVAEEAGDGQQEARPRLAQRSGQRCSTIGMFPSASPSAAGPGACQPGPRVWPMR